MSQSYAIGRLLRAGTAACVVGCRVDQAGAPVFGSLVRIPLEEGYQVFGLITDIHIDDDGLVRQLVTAEAVLPEVLADNRVNRNVPVEFSVLHCGYELNGRVSHLLPPRPPLSLDAIDYSAGRMAWEPRRHRAPEASLVAYLEEARELMSGSPVPPPPPESYSVGPDFETLRWFLLPSEVTGVSGF